MEEELLISTVLPQVEEEASAWAVTHRMWSILAEFSGQHDHFRRFGQSYATLRRDPQSVRTVWRVEEFLLLPGIESRHSSPQPVDSWRHSQRRGRRKVPLIDPEKPWERNWWRTKYRSVY